MRTLSVAALALLVSVLLAPLGWVHGEGLELKLGHVGPPGSLFDLSAQEFARRANAKLGERAHVAVFGGSQLGDDAEALQRIKLGTLDFALPSSLMSTAVPEFGLFEMPYLVKDRAHMARIETEILWPTLAPLAEKAGFKILAVWENGFRQITNNQRPITTPADLRGMKLRVPKGKWRSRMFTDYGAVPLPLALPEVFGALKAGGVDGQENPLTQIYASRFQEVQRFLSMTDHVYTPAYLIVSPSRWQGLPADVRTMLGDAAKETQALVYEAAAREDKDVLEKLKAAGMQVNAADRTAFIAASRKVYEAFAAEVPTGRELVERCQKLAPGK